MNAPASITASACGQVDVIDCDESSAASWDAFVTAASGSYCHLFGWKRVIERAYGMRAHYLVFRSADTWRAILPLAILPRLPRQMRRAVSLPYCNYGGLLAAPGVDATQLKRAAINHLPNLGVEQIELREWASGPNDSNEVTMILPIPGNSDLLWEKIGAKVRNQIRKAQKSGLTTHWGRNQGDELYRIYARNMGRLGTPVHSPRFIREIIAQFPEQADVLTVRHAGQAIGAMLLIRQGTTWSDPIASCLPEFNALNPNMLLYWEALRYSTESGGRSFDFGRSHKDSGTYRFKKQWGAEEKALDYQTYRNGVRQPLTTATFYRSSSAARLSRLWQLLPGPVQHQLGPMVRRWMP